MSQLHGSTLEGKPYLPEAFKFVNSSQKASPCREEHLLNFLAEPRAHTMGLCCSVEPPAEFKLQEDEQATRIRVKQQAAVAKS